jgi:mono/diheme cytochrome c family protein
MKGSPLAGEVKTLMETGSLEPVVKRSGNTVMGYYPMKLAPACVSCHAQNGLKQTEGGFGGALRRRDPGQVSVHDTATVLRLLPWAFSSSSPRGWR